MPAGKDGIVNNRAGPSQSLIWAYVHGELPEAERRSFEQSLALDPALRRSVAATGILDQRLRTAFAVLDADETAWADRALAAWERDQEAPRTLPWTRRLRWPIIASLGAAAALVLLLTPPADNRMPQWDRPVFVPLVTRGDAPAAPAAQPASATATDCDLALRAALADAWRARNLVPRPGLVLAMRMLELPHGAFAVVVQARNRNGSQVQEWSGDYSSAESFIRQLPASARCIAESLAVTPRP
jgi:anti-sigma factor RsiW